MAKLTGQKSRKAQAMRMPDNENKGLEKGVEVKSKWMEVNLTEMFHGAETDDPVVVMFRPDEQGNYEHVTEQKLKDTYYRAKYGRQLTPNDVSKEAIGLRIRKSRNRFGIQHHNGAGKVGISQQELAERVGWPDGKTRIGNYERGDRAVHPDDLKKLADALEVDFEWLMTGKRPMTEDIRHFIVNGLGQEHITDDAVRDITEMTYYSDAVETRRQLENMLLTPVSLYDITAEMGDGAEALNEEPGDTLVFQTGWIKQQGLDPSELAIIHVAGNSMHPTLSQGDIVMIDKSKRDDKRDGIYAIQHDNRVRVKRLIYRLNGNVEIISDNNSYPPEVVDNTDSQISINVIGKVVWRGGYIL